MATTCTISGNLEDLTSADNQGYVLFDLVNFTDNIPRVIGTAALVSNHYEFQADASGVVSGTLWGNDSIDPAGTLYRVSVLDDTRVVVETDTFNITGNSWNLNTAVPSPVPPMPTTQDYVIVGVTSSAAGNFTVGHSLGKLPTFASVKMTSGGFLWFQSPTNYDKANLYLVASDASVTADIFVW